MSTGAGALLEFVREEDFVEYFLFPKLNTEIDEIDKTQNELQNLLTQINQLIQCHTNVYLWHKDEFSLSVRTAAHQLLNDDENNDPTINLPPHLYGISHYGDNIQDEWFIVFLIFEITRKIPGIIGRVIDSDGEFLLIEAADVLPKWANPETCEQRVFIYNGHLQLVQNSSSNSLVSITTGITKIWFNPNLYRVTGEIQNFIDERLEEFTNFNNHSIHHQIINIPIGVAAILHEKPSLIAAACRAFCDRDTIDLKVCRVMRYFPPENRVRTNVKFTRCLYAMITHQNYIPDRRIGWELPTSTAAIETDKYKEDILGVKIACGFEILASQANADAGDDDCIELDRTWKLYLNSLMKKGYFQENIEGSQNYCKLLEQAKHFYIENKNRFRTVPLVGKEILKLLHEIDINTEEFKQNEKNLRKSDNDSWLNITAEDLENILTEKYGIKKLYKANGDINAEQFTQNITEFLDKKSEFDGIEIVEETTNNSNVETTVPQAVRRVKKNSSMRQAINNNPITMSSTKPSNDINFEPDAFTTHVKNFLDFVIPEDNWESNSEMSDYEDDDDLEKNIEDMQNTKMTIETDIKNYMAQMDRELAQTTIGQSFVGATAAGAAATEHSDEHLNDSNPIVDDFDDIESFQPININVNTLKNMMDSYKSQIGGSGPTSNLLNAMGLGVSANSIIDTKASSPAADISETQV